MAGEVTVLRPERKDSRYPGSEGDGPELQVFEGDGGETLPARTGTHIRKVTALDTTPRIRAEMARVYRMQWRGRIGVRVGTMLMKQLEMMLEAIRLERDMAVAEQAYSEAWSGIEVIYATSKDDDEGDEG